MQDLNQDLNPDKAISGNINLETQAYKLFSEGSLDEAEVLYRELIQFSRTAKLLTNLGGVLFCNDKTEQALASFQEALEINPNYADAKTFLGISLLKLGDYDQGWIEYEARIHSNQFKDALKRFSRYLWSGQATEGKIILIRAEQGIGDNIQFIRFFKPLVEKFGCKIVFHCRPEMKRLFESCEGIDRLICNDGETVEECSGCAYVGSLPLILKTNLQTLPAQTPYLKASSQSVEKWQQIFNQPELKEKLHKKRLKIGIANSGNPKNPLNRFRSIPIQLIKELIQSHEADFFCIQKGNEELSGLELDNFYDLSPQIEDFDDTAAFYGALDLVVSVDTSVIHLAGALNKKALLLLSKAGDWRWMSNRTDSPWYPSVEIIRQDQNFEWKPLLKELSCKLTQINAQALGV